MLSFITSGIAALAMLMALQPLAAVAAIANGQVDDFEDGSLQGWSVGAANPQPPINVASGGPGGPDDNYLGFASTGVAGPGGKLALFAVDHWTGDYLAAGVSSIRMQVRNFGQTDLLLRLILEDGVHFQSLISAGAVSLLAGGDWTSVSFALGAADLVGGDYATVLGSVTTLNLVHSPGTVPARSSVPNIAAQIGVDNIAAVPEPKAFALLALGLGVFALRIVSRPGRATTTG